ncbi:hypothetical protein MNV_1110014 [Candidatus Methanoperedens nitroreducens]|uniref:Uncharacterized protein n=2 Tax=Candidatus Methanoperedens nitratireducens TaxID=1392998 RepID=A0A284VJ41_9EURY|nr:hypothetical protein MNV_1110014 [Candidatus Methanoperedens nitroreducens]
MNLLYINALGVKVKVEEEEADVIDFNKDPDFAARSTLTIKCKCGNILVTQPMVLLRHGRECEKCKRRYIGER